MQFIDLNSQYRRIQDEVKARVERVLEHGQFVLGPEVGELERRLAEYVGVRHAIAVASGTDALVMALMALDIGPGDEVITTPFTFAATANAVRLVGADVVFSDIEPDSFNLDPAGLEARIGPRTRAIIPVDLYGRCADYAAIEAVAARHGLAVIADAAQSFGACSGERRAGSYGDIATTSFFPAKPLGTCGDGGAVFTNDDDLAARVRQIRVHGQDEDGRLVRLGFTGRLDTLKAAVLLAKLDILDDEMQRRTEIAQRYDALLADPRIVTPALPAGWRSAWALYTVRLQQRDAVHDALQAAGIPVRVYYGTPLHRQPVYAGSSLSLPVAERCAAEVLSLPMHPYLDPEDQQLVAGRLIETLDSLVSRPVAQASD